MTDTKYLIKYLYRQAQKLNLNKIVRFSAINETWRDVSKQAVK